VPADPINDSLRKSLLFAVLCYAKNPSDAAFAFENLSDAYITRALFHEPRIPLPRTFALAQLQKSAPRALFVARHARHKEVVERAHTHRQKEVRAQAEGNPAAVRRSTEPSWTQQLEELCSARSEHYLSGGLAVLLARQQDPYRANGLMLALAQKGMTDPINRYLEHYYAMPGRSHFPASLFGAADLHPAELLVTLPLQSRNKALRRLMERNARNYHPTVPFDAKIIDLFLRSNLHDYFSQVTPGHLHRGVTPQAIDAILAQKHLTPYLVDKELSIPQAREFLHQVEGRRSWKYSTLSDTQWFYRLRNQAYYEMYHPPLPPGVIDTSRDLEEVDPHRQALVYDPRLHVENALQNSPTSGAPLQWSLFLQKLCATDPLITRVVRRLPPDSRMLYLYGHLSANDQLPIFPEPRDVPHQLELARTASTPGISATPREMMGNPSLHYVASVAKHAPGATAALLTCQQGKRFIARVLTEAGNLPQAIDQFVLAAPFATVREIETTIQSLARSTGPR
jgi:hypothetical protein